MQMVHSASWAVRPAIGDKRVSETEPVARIVFVFRRDAGKRLTRRHIDGRSAVDCI
jgi:hypothetical protein